MEVVTNRLKCWFVDREDLHSAVRRATLIVSGFALTGCASAGPPPVQQPPPNAGALASAAQVASAVERPYRIVFEWSMLERGARYRGTGVGRIAPIDQAKLELFLPNAESVASATMVGDNLAVRSNEGTRLPNAPLLWGALGVFRPGSAVSQGGRWGSSGAAELRYLVNGSGEELLYYLRDNRVERMEVYRDGRRIEELRLTYVEGERFPRVAEYRHLDPNDLRELTIALETVEYVETYPSDTFMLP